MKVQNKSRQTLLQYFAILLTLSNILILTTSCSKKNSDATSAPIIDPSDGTGLTKNDVSNIKEITLAINEVNGSNKFVASTNHQLITGEPNVIEGMIHFNLTYKLIKNETDRTNGYTTDIKIFSLTHSEGGFSEQHFALQDFDQNLDRGIYIISVKISNEKTKDVQNLKAKIVVMCPESEQNNQFEINPQLISVKPVANIINWPGPPPHDVVFGIYEYDLSHVVTNPGISDLNKFVYDIDRDGDGEISIDAHGDMHLGYGIDLIAKKLLNPFQAYSVFADGSRKLHGTIFDACYNSKSFEVTLPEAIFAATEKEDINSSSVMPSLNNDPSYMMHSGPMSSNNLRTSNIPFYQENTSQLQNNATLNQKIDARLNGKLSFNTATLHAGITCKQTGNQVEIRANEITYAESQGYNLNLIEKYSNTLLIKNLYLTNFNGSQIYSGSNAVLTDYNKQVPGAGDHIGAMNLKNEGSCSLQLVLPIVNKVNTPCGSTATGGSGIIITNQDLHGVFLCPVVSESGSGNNNKKITVAGEFYCKQGVVSKKVDCIYPNNPAPPGNGPPVPPTNPPPNPQPE